MIFFIKSCNIVSKTSKETPEIESNNSISNSFAKKKLNLKTSIIKKPTKPTQKKLSTTEMELLSQNNEISNPSQDEIVAARQARKEARQLFKKQAIEKKNAKKAATDRQAERQAVYRKVYEDYRAREAEEADRIRLRDEEDQQRHEAFVAERLRENLARDPAFLERTELQKQIASLESQLDSLKKAAIRAQLREALYKASRLLTLLQSDEVYDALEDKDTWQCDCSDHRCEGCFRPIRRAFDRTQEGLEFLHHELGVVQDDEPSDDSDDTEDDESSELEEVQARLREVQEQLQALPPPLSN